MDDYDTIELKAVADSDDAATPPSNSELVESGLELASDMIAAGDHADCIDEIFCELLNKDREEGEDLPAFNARFRVEAIDLLRAWLDKNG